MKNIIERALFNIGDILDKQNFLPQVKAKSKTPFTLNELVDTLPKSPNNFYYSYNVKEDFFEYVSPNVFKTFGIKPQTEPKKDFFFELFAPDYMNEFNRINESCFWFAAKNLSLSTLYKYYITFVFKYQFPGGTIKTYLNHTYPQATNALGQVTKLYLIQTDISNVDFINDNVLTFQSTDPELPSYITFNHWNRYDKSHKRELNLTNRNKIIIEFFGEGLNNKQIGDQLELSEETIKSIRKEMLRKTDRASMYELLTD